MNQNTIMYLVHMCYDLYDTGTEENSITHSFFRGLETFYVSYILVVKSIKQSLRIGFIKLFIVSLRNFICRQSKCNANCSNTLGLP